MAKEVVMQMNTSVFIRIVEEHKASVESMRKAAVTAIADSMEEAVRWGHFDRPGLEDRASARLEAQLSQKTENWTPRRF